MAQVWDIPELEAELRNFEAVLRRAKLAESSIRTYVDRSAIFVRWLAGEYRPSGPRR